MSVLETAAKAVPAHVLEGLICLGCGSQSLEAGPDSLACAHCRATFPVVQGIPVLVSDGKGLFRQSDFLARKNLFFDLSPFGRAIQRVSRLLPSFAAPGASRRNYAELARLLAARPGRPRVLIVGGSIGGEGIEPLLRAPGLDILESDVSFGPRTAAVLDAHHIPYAEGSFDAVVCQAVFEHVTDPFRCAAEFHRVLKRDGLLYAETPFMQQVHGGAYDFTRFTLSGHRRLLREFSEIASGSVSGPGTAMAWSYEYLLIALLGHGRSLRHLAKAFARFTGFWLKYLDALAAANPASLDGACGLYFLGRKAARALSDEEIIAYYRDRAVRGAASQSA